MKHEVTIAGMHCESCVGRVTKALSDIPEITSVSVTLNPPVARLDIAQNVGMKTLRGAVKSVGDYDITQALKSSPRVSWLKTYYPLLLIVGFLIAATTLLAYRAGQFDESAIMGDFMGLFFVTFAFFKLLDVRGFAKSFRTYDLIAEQSRAYGLAYPFIELGLGVAYLTRVYPLVTNFVTLVLMLIGTFGVIGALQSKRKIKCACLGTVFNLPMSKVTLIENLTMAFMALMVLYRLVT